MSTTRSAFSERLFEFSFNAEFIDRNEAILVGAPDIPTQEDEKWLGYDVAFELQRSPGVTGSLALQHKVPRLVDGPGSSANKHFRNAAGPTYFVFPLDVDQFNIIQALAAQKLPGIEFYFCAPLFISRKDINGKYSAREIEKCSIWIDVASAGALDPNERHSLLYAPDGSAAWVFSEEGRALSVKKPAERERKANVNQAWSTETVVSIYRAVRHELDLAWPEIEARRLQRQRRQRRAPADDTALVASALSEALPLPMPDRELRERALRETAHLLSTYLGMSWLVEVAP